jgi:5-oxopent-3-ene-1,2,5-tricarboxylate decarboxylase / 2-hydroxyhepta-2,4-diene-1,7-dioate isomerase
MKTARVAFGGAIHRATPVLEPGATAGLGAARPSERSPAVARLQLADGRVVSEDEVVWLPPFEPATVIALGLNYADHVKELARELTVGARDEPLVFFKTASSVIGHRGFTPRPAGVGFMHYECELAVVIGAPARRVRAADAARHVAGYTVCNDYAVRDHLENWYRPNLPVKNRDGGTVLGPWLVDAADVPDPHALELRTWVNGELRQQGHTRHMVNDIPALIEYLSSFMTLQPGDVILTGTPEGVSNVSVGDEVVCEIEGIGRLVNTLIEDAGAARAA